MSLPSRTAEASLYKTSNHYGIFSTDLTGPDTAGTTWPYSGARVVPAGDVTVFGCPCSTGSTGTTGGGTTSGGTTSGPPGVCQCSSVLGIGCSVSSNSCNPGFVPQCNCGVTGNSCQCVPSAQ
jgi:hypothetical protein